MENKNKNTNAHPKRSEKFYMDIVVFKVENMLFKVPKTYFVNNSPIFRDMFSLPQADSANPEGSSDSNPLMLEGVKAEDFERLLACMYPDPRDVVPYLSGTTKEYNTRQLFPSTPNDALPLIKLARKWMLRGLHAELVRVYEGGCGREVMRTGDDWIVLGKEHGIPGWIRRGYVELATSSQTITLSQVNRIGVEDAVRIFQLREEFARRSATNPYTNTSHHHDRVNRVESVFEQSLKAVDTDYQNFYANDP